MTWAVARAWCYQVLEEGNTQTPMARIAEVLLILLIIGNVAAAALETVPSIDQTMHGFFRVFEKISIQAYTLEYVLRIWCATEDPRVAQLGPLRGRISFAMRPFMVVDFLAFAPSYLSFIFRFDLRVLRIFRLFRLLKLARYSQALPALLGVLYAERAALLASMILLFSTTCASAELMHFVEGAAQPDKFGTVPGAMYWAITTLTTVGYGDVTPVTPLGKFIAGITMILGLALFALPIGIIANGFVVGLHRRRFPITWSLLKQIPLFVGLKAATLSDLMDTLNASIIREHSHVTIAGESADTLAVVVSGRGRVEDDVDESDLDFGAVIGEEAFSHGAIYSRTTTALSEMRLIELPGGEWRRLARKHPDLRERLQTLADTVQPWGPVRDRMSVLEAENAQLREAVIRLTLQAEGIN